MHSVAWLVDVGYVVGASEGLFRLDYARAERLIRQRRGPVQSYLFNGYDAAYGISPGLLGFYRAMRAQGMVVRLHPMAAGPPGENRQRRVDVDLGAHLVWQASVPEVETVVLTSGDQDILPAVQIARKQLGKQLVLFTYRENVSHELVENVDAWWLFEESAGELAR
jgi:hypothetical protein